MLLNMVGRNEEDFTNVLKRDGDEDAVVVIQWTLDFGVMAPTVHKVCITASFPWCHLHINLLTVVASALVFDLDEIELQPKD